MQQTQIIHGARLGLFLLALGSTFSLIPLSLLPRLLFLALRKSRSPSWHGQALLEWDRKLPTWFARLPRLAAMIVSPASATTTAAKAASSAPASTRTVSLRLRLIDRQGPATHIRSVQGGDGLLSFTGVSHLDEGEAPRTSCITVGHHRNFFHPTMRLEETSQIRFSGTVR
jgi:hypothetical protein